MREKLGTFNRVPDESRVVPTLSTLNLATIVAEAGSLFEFFKIPAVVYSHLPMSQPATFVGGRRGSSMLMRS